MSFDASYFGSMVKMLAKLESFYFDINSLKPLYNDPSGVVSVPISFPTFSFRTIEFYFSGFSSSIASSFSYLQTKDPSLHLVKQHEFFISLVAVETEGLHPLLEASTVGPDELVEVLALHPHGHVVPQLHLRINESALCTWPDLILWIL